ncbi:hypothetical protein C5B26_13270 [Neisseria gonorrhoeae]|nr:hypothetical protein C5B26_13270 [Neisseria gonorrhoeae]
MKKPESLVLVKAHDSHSITRNHGFSSMHVSCLVHDKIHLPVVPFVAINCAGLVEQHIES